MVLIPLMCDHNNCCFIKLIKAQRQTRFGECGMFKAEKKLQFTLLAYTLFAKRIDRTRRELDSDKYQSICRQIVLLIVNSLVNSLKSYYLTVLVHLNAELNIHRIR